MDVAEKFPGTGVLLLWSQPQGCAESPGLFLKRAGFGSSLCHLLAVRSARAPITKSQGLGGIDIETYFLTMPEAQVQDQGASVAGFWRGPSSWLADG